MQSAECRIERGQPSSFFFLHSSFCILHSLVSGGEGGIRTPDTREGITVFETAAFSHSATSPLVWDACATPGKNAAAGLVRAPLRSPRRLPADDSNADPAPDCRASRRSLPSDPTRRRSAAALLR